VCRQSSQRLERRRRRSLTPAATISIIIPPHLPRRRACRRRHRARELGSAALDLDLAPLIAEAPVATVPDARHLE
jgi:hypothetical protein